MKKFISVLAAITVASAISTDIYAASITINKAEKTSTNAVSVECTVTDPDPYQEITVISCEENNKDYSKDLIYIDQYKTEMSSTNNKFSFEFSPASWSDFVSNDKAYIVRIGGSNVDTPAVMAIASYGGTVVYTTGDINGDGIIDKKDAILLLKYTSGIAKLTEAQIEAGNVNKDGNVDILDVSEILKKTNEGQK